MAPSDNSDDRSENPTSDASTAPAGEPEFLEATDGFGRKIRFTRDEYRQRVIPELLKAHGNDPAGLANVIMQGLQQGFAKELIGAANRLVVIDKDPERALTVLAVAQRDAGLIDAAEFTLSELEQKRPESIAPLIGRAMLAQRRGDPVKCSELLWQALERDCNHPDAVHGWLQCRQQAGDTDQRANLDRLCEFEGAWRAKLLRARLDLEGGRSGEAIAAYREVLAREGLTPDALFLVATDLANHKELDALEELVLPRFVPGQHHPHVGLALLHLHAARKRHVEGADLLHHMYVHYGHLIGEALFPFTGEFDRLRLERLPPVEAPSEPRIGLYRFDLPAFCSGLHEPLWLLPKKQEGHKQILFMGLTIDGRPEPGAGREEEIGRMTRGVPLFLAEHVWLASPHRGSVGLPMSNGSWALMGQPWPEEQIVEQLTAEERPHTLLVTGVLRVDGDSRRIDLWVYDVAKKERIGHVAGDRPANEFGDLLLQLLRELWPVIGGPAEHAPPVGDAAFWQRHADGLAQHAALVVALAGAMPPERLYGERYILHWLQETALSEPRWQPGFWLYASALCVLKELGSNVPEEHARAVAELFRQSPPETPFARIAVRPLHAVGLANHWQQRRPDIVAKAGGDLAYGQWLERIEALA